MQKVLKISLIMIGLIFLVACSSRTTNENETMVEAEIMIVSGDFPHYTNIEHLASNASEVVRVEVLSERVEAINIWLPPQNEFEDTGEVLREAYFIYTIHQLRILEVFKGDVNVGDILEVKQIGGQLDGLTVINDDKISFGAGDDLVLFLQSFDDVPASLLNPDQSAYRFTISNEDARNRNIDDALESLSMQNNLTLTLNDLASILASNND